VLFSQGRTKIYCDSAYLYKKTNNIEAFGRIRIVDDSVTITSKKLFYNGNTRIARLRENVVYRSKDFTLYTNNLDYDRLRSEAFYFNKGRLVDSTNVVTSQKGYFQSWRNTMAFKTNVVMTNKKETLRSDTLIYNTRSKMVNFVAPTTVTDVQGAVVTYEEGVYNTTSKQSTLSAGDIDTEDYYIKGDRLQLDNARAYYKIIGNAYLFDKQEEVQVDGRLAEHDKKKQMTKVYGGQVVLKKDMDGDTLYITADTLLSINNEAEKKLLAWRNVEIYRTDFQARPTRWLITLKTAPLRFITTLFYGQKIRS